MFSFGCNLFSVNNLALVALEIICTTVNTINSLRGVTIRSKIVCIFAIYHKSRSLEIPHIVSPTCTIMIEPCERIIRLINAIFIESAHLSVDQILTGYKFSVNHIIHLIEPTVCHNDSIYINFAIGIYTTKQFVTSTPQYSSHRFIAMTSCRNNRTPINYRITNLTEGSARVTIGSTSCLTISHSRYSVLMPAFASSSLGVEPCLSAFHRLSGVVCEEQLCVNKKCLHAEGVLGLVNESYNTLLKSEFNALCPYSTVTYQPSGSCEFVTLISCVLSCPCTNRECKESRLTCRNYITSLLDDDCSDIVILLDGVRNSKACCNLHTIEFPRACVIHIEYKFNLFDCLDIGGNNIHPIERTNQDAVCSGIPRNNLNSSIVACSNYNTTGSPRFIAHLISNGELNSMITNRKIYATKCNLTICIITFYLLTIDISLSGCSIDANSVSKRSVLYYCNFERRIAVVDNLTIHSCKALGNRVCYHGVREDRSFTIINSSRVIQCDIINIECILTVYVRLSNIVIVVVSCVSCTVINRDVDVVELIVRGLRCDVMPALVELKELTVTIVCRTNLHLNVTSIIRNIQPETDSYCICTINCGECKVQSMVTGFENLCEITLNSQCVVTVLYLTSCRIHNGDISTLVLTMVPVVTVIVCYLTVRACGAVLTVVCVDLPACEILILEIVNDLRTLTQAQVCCSRNLTNCSSQQRACCSNTFLTSGEVEAVNSTDVSI